MAAGYAEINAPALVPTITLTGSLTSRNRTDNAPDAYAPRAPPPPNTKPAPPPRSLPPLTIPTLPGSSQPAPPGRA